MPAEGWRRLKCSRGSVRANIQGFLDEGKTGSVTLEVPGGEVLSWSIVEADKRSNRCPDCKAILLLNREGPGYWCRRCAQVVT